MNAEEMKLLQAQNEALKKQCNSLQQEVKQWKYEYEILDACLELEQGKIAELKEEIEIRDNLSEKFRKEALSWANIANEYQKDKTKLEKTLQEIKTIAEECTTCGDCFNCKYTEHCSTDIEAQALGVCRMILKLITKAEEE